MCACLQYVGTSPTSWGASADVGSSTSMSCGRRQAHRRSRHAVAERRARTSGQMPEWSTDWPIAHPDLASRLAQGDLEVAGRYRRWDRRALLRCTAMTKATAQASAADAHGRLMLEARSGLTDATTANYAAPMPTVHVGVIHPRGSVAANRTRGRRRLQSRTVSASDPDPDGPSGRRGLRPIRLTMFAPPTVDAGGRRHSLRSPTPEWTCWDRWAALHGGRTVAR